MMLLVFFKWLTAVFFCIGVLISISILSKSHETGEDPWIWIPFMLILPVVGVPVYIIYKLIKASGDHKREVDQFKADSGRGGYVSRRVKSEEELRENYYRGRRRR
jgi:hypothetical protein